MRFIDKIENHRVKLRHLEIELGQSGQAIDVNSSPIIIEDINISKNGCNQLEILPKKMENS